MKKDKMTADEIVTHYLKTGEIPEFSMILPKEKVTLQKNGNLTIHYRDILDEIKKIENNPFKELDSEQINLITSDIPDFHEKRRTVQILDIIYRPEKYISIFKSEHAKKVVFVDQNLTGTVFMKNVLILYLRLCLNPEEYINSENEINKRIIQYLQTQFDWMVEILERIIKMEKQPSSIDKDITDKKPKLLKEKTEVIINGLNEYHFSEYLSKNKFKAEGIYQLIKVHSGRELMPYTIALLNEIGYLDYFFNEFTKTKTEGFKKLGEVFAESERRIKGNVYVLIPQSEENPSQYTSSQYKKTIQKELKHL